MPKKCRLTHQSVTRQEGIGFSPHSRRPSKAAIPQKVFDFSGTPAPRQAICFTFLVKIIDCLKPLKPYALLPFIVGAFFLSAIWGMRSLCIFTPGT